MGRSVCCGAAFPTLGFTPFEIASLFLFYEFFGIVTNAVGGWLGARIGLNRTMQIGLLIQIRSIVDAACTRNYVDHGLGDGSAGTLWNRKRPQ